MTTAFGFAWAVLQPVVFLAIYVVVFGFILRSGRPAESAREFAFYMLSGMLPFLAIAEGLHRAITALREDRGLLDQQSFPAEVVPASRIVTASVAEAVGLVLLLASGLIIGSPMTGWVLLLPLLFALRIQIALGLAWFISTLALFVTDLAEVLSLALTAWLFLTPVFYRPAEVPGFLSWMLFMNPLHHVVEAYRSVLLDGRAPFPEGLFLIGWAGLLSGTGWWFFRKTVDRGKDFL